VQAPREDDARWEEGLQRKVEDPDAAPPGGGAEGEIPLGVGAIRGEKGEAVRASDAAGAPENKECQGNPNDVLR
jgi:hypothetical protein